MTAGGGLGYLGTQIDTEGGQGASGQYGSGGDGGDANFCQDEPWNCVVAGAAVGAGGAYLIYKLRKIHKNKKSAN